MHILGQGYLKYVEHWGSDEQIVESARLSTGKGFRGWGNELNPGDEKFLKYLWDNRHTSPFEMAGFTVEVKAPIFVFREWHRHRTQSYSEMSARYVKLPNEFYMPDIERLINSAQSQVNKQSSTSGFSPDEAKAIQVQMEFAYNVARNAYEQLIARGVSREVARLVLPVSQFSVMRAQANLLNWLKFLSLRLPNNAQWEIRVYAQAVKQILIEKFPRVAAIVTFGE